MPNKKINQIQIGTSTYDMEPANNEVLNASHITDALGYTPAGTTELAAEISARETADAGLSSRIDSLESRGRYLSGWNCTTGKPDTDPTDLPYTYRAGDYYIVSTVGDTNYRPSGPSYTGAASTTAEESTVSIGDTYTYDGTGQNWVLTHTPAVQDTNQKVSGNGVTFDVNDVVDFVGSGATVVSGNSATKKIIISSTNTTYESKTAIASGTDVSLVTTGEKYT